MATVATEIEEAATAKDALLDLVADGKPFVFITGDLDVKTNTFEVVLTTNAPKGYYAALRLLVKSALDSIPEESDVEDDEEEEYIPRKRCF